MGIPTQGASFRGGDCEGANVTGGRHRSSAGGRRFSTAPNPAASLGPRRARIGVSSAKPHVTGGDVSEPLISYPVCVLTG
jgi:hypothetical protein